jgi:hypothetical protein
VVKASGWQSLDRQFEPYPCAIKAVPSWCGLGCGSRLMLECTNKGEKRGNPGARSGVDLVRGDNVAVAVDVWAGLGAGGGVRQRPPRALALEEVHNFGRPSCCTRHHFGSTLPHFG